MGNEAQGLATFPGINQIVGGTITRIHGISPSVAVLTIAPQEDMVAEIGTLEFFQGPASIQWPNSKIDYASLSLSEEGWIWQLTILDRRWRWHERNGGGGISGRYNVWRDDFSLEDGKNDPQQANTQTNTIDTEKTPQELLRLCLKALEEKGYDVSQVPDDTRPPVDWDYTNPAHAMAELCDFLGCIIVLRADDTIAILPIGVGADLPTDNDVMNPGFTLDPAEIPEKLAIVCSERFQVDLDLEGVGYDVPKGFDVTVDNLQVDPSDKQPTASGELVKKINDLSYAIDPNDTNNFGGFSFGDLSYMMNVGKDVNGIDDVTGIRELALMVGRLYRVVPPEELPGYDDEDGNIAIERLEQILPLETELILKWWTNSELQPMPAQLFGVYWPQLKGLANNIPTLVPAPVMPPRKTLQPGQTTTFWMRGFQIDAERGLVTTDEPCIKNNDTIATPLGLKTAPADLILRCTVQVRDRKTLAIKRYIRELDTGSKSGSGTRYIHKTDEITLTHIPIYDANSYSLTGEITNKESVDEKCDFYLQQALSEYQNVNSQQTQYASLRTDIEMDGAIQQITYSLAPAVTIVSRNSEMRHTGMSFRERRLAERTRKMAAEAKRGGTLAKPAQQRGGGF